MWDYLIVQVDKHLNAILSFFGFIAFSFSFYVRRLVSLFLFWIVKLNSVSLIFVLLQRQCLSDGKSSVETLVEYGLTSVEGMSFDWVTNMLYFVDGIRAKIEVIRTDINHSGRFRRTILDREVLQKPRGIVVHPMEG